jgi:hypothetical protein
LVVLGSHVQLCSWKQIAAKPHVLKVRGSVCLLRLEKVLEPPNIGKGLEDELNWPPLVCLWHCAA